MNSLRILQVMNCAVYGGLSLHALTLSRGLVTAGYQVEVVSMKDGPLVPTVREAGIGIEVVHFEGRLLKRDPLLVLRTISGVRRVVRKFQPDIVHTHGPRAHFFGGIARRLEKVPLHVASAHGTHTQFVAGNERDLGRFRSAVRQQQFAAIDRLTVRFADCVVAVCEATRQELVSGLGVPADKIAVVVNGIEENPVSVQEAKTLRQALGFNEEQKVIVYVGSVSRHKGLPVLLAAFRMLVSSHPDCRLLVVGEGSYFDQMKADVSSAGLGDSVVLTGRRPDAVLLMAAGDVLVLPSLSEGLSLTLLEAAMLGRPMVATDVGGNAEVVKEGETGLLVPPGDPLALAASLAAVADDDQLREEMGKAARSLWESRYTVTRMVDDMAALYRREYGKRPA